MQDDERCCGTGTCIIDDQGRCWCGQQWDGTKMCYPTHATAPNTGSGETPVLPPDNAVDTADTP